MPRLPRGRGLRLSLAELTRIIGLAGVLVILVVTQRHCSNAVATFVTSFGSGSATAALPRPGTVDLPGGGARGDSAAGPDRSPPAPGLGSPGSAGHDLDGYERLHPGMTDAEIKAAIERARARAADTGERAPAAVTPQAP